MFFQWYWWHSAALINSKTLAPFVFIFVNTTFVYKGTFLSYCSL